MMRNILWRCGVVLLLIGMIAPLEAAAQDGGGLTADQLALLDRVKAARENYLAYDSLVENVYGSQSQELIITLGDNQQSFSTITGWERSARIIRQEDGQNIAAEAMATIVNSGSQTGDENSRNIGLNAEFLLVDGKTYVLASYGPDTSPDPSLPALPESWFEVERLRDWPVLEVLELQDLVEQRSVFDDLESMKEAVADVTIAPGVLEDGTEVDAITVTLDAAGVAQLLSMDEPLEPALENILGSLSPDSGATLTVLLDAENHPFEAVTEMMLTATNLDASVFGFERLPDGTTVEFTAVFARRETISQVNETLEPAVIPDELAD